jgi:hypothetical protein
MAITIAIAPAMFADEILAAFPVSVVVVAEEVELAAFEIGEVEEVIETTGEEVGARVTMESWVVVDSVESAVAFVFEEEDEDEDEEVPVSEAVDEVAAILPLGPHPGR